MSTSSAMKLLEERHVAARIDKIVWSEKIDLLALSNFRGEVSLHRLSWQKVWTFQPPKEGLLVVRMAWRPDGKVIAVAYDNGDLLLIDVENKDVLNRVHFENKINCVAWVQEREVAESKHNFHHCHKNNSSKYVVHDSSNNFVPRLPPLLRNLVSINKYIEDGYEDSKRVKDLTLLNFLLVGLNTGKLFINIFGLFSCGVIDLNCSLEHNKYSILRADIMDDLSSLLLVVLFEDTKSTEDKIDSEPISPDSKLENEIRLVFINTPILSSRCHELYALASKHGQIVSIMSYLEQTMLSITEAWENILLEMDSKLALYAATVPDGSISADFLDLLMFGIPTDELQMFLLRDLTEKGLKKLGHTIELSYSNIQKLVLKHLHSVGRSLNFHISELKGMARRSDIYRLIGLNESSVIECLKASGSFLIKATEVQQVIDGSMRNYKAFFRWLYVSILRLTDERMPCEITKMNQQELTFISEFLFHFDGLRIEEKGDPEIKKEKGTAVSTKSKFNLEQLGQYLVDKDLVIPSGWEINPWAVFLKLNSNLTKLNEAVFPHFEKMSLVQQYKHLIKAVEAVFSEPETQISKQFKLSHILNLIKVNKNRENIKICHSYSSDNSKLILIFLISDNFFYYIELANNIKKVYTQSKVCRVYFVPQVKAKKLNSFKKNCSIKKENSISEDFFGNDYIGREIYAEDEVIENNTSENEHENWLRIVDVQFYSHDILSVLLRNKEDKRNSIFVQFPIRATSELAKIVQIPTSNTDTCTADFENSPLVEGNKLLESGTLRPLENILASKFSVSGPRRVSAILSESGSKIRLFEMEAEEEEDDEEGMDASTNSVRDSDQSAIGMFKGLDVEDE